MSVSPPQDIYVVCQNQRCALPNTIPASEIQVFRRVDEPQGWYHADCRHCGLTSVIWVDASHLANLAKRYTDLRVFLMPSDPNLEARAAHIASLRQTPDERDRQIPHIVRNYSQIIDDFQANYM